MEVILRTTVEKLGRAGDIIDVKPGYGRNYLIPRGLAYAATDGNKRRVAAEAKAQGAKVAAVKEDADLIATRLAELEINFTVKAGEADKLFGSITSGDIAEKLQESGIDVDKRQIELDEPIKMIGVYKVPVKLHPDVRPEVRVWVVKAE